MRTFTIELRMDATDPNKVEIIKKAARMAAKHLFATALLVADKRKPQIVMHSGDFFESDKEINLADDIEE